MLSGPETRFNVSSGTGACIGAALGILENGGHLRSLQPLDRPYRVGGINARLNDDRLDLLLVTDAHDPGIAAALISTSITK